MKKQLQRSVTCTGLLFLNSLFAMAQWTSIAPVPAGLIGNDGAVSFTIGNKGYIIAGTGTKNIFAFDTVTTSWALVDSIPPAAGQAFAMSFQINGKGYVVGGDAAGVPINAVWEFDPSQSANRWSQKNNFPGGVRDAGFGFALNNYGYVGAGNNNISLFNDIWKYDPVADSWTQLPTSIPINGLIFPVSFVIGNKGYIGTGGTNPAAVNEVRNMWCLDGSNDSLSAIASFGGTGRQAAFAFSNNSYGYIGGGQTNYTTNYNDMWQYDPVINQWTVAPAAPLLGAAWSSAFVIGNTAYAGLGAKFVSAGLTGNLNFYKYSMSIVTGIGNVGPANSMIVSCYPNPASGFIHVEFSNAASMHMDIYSSTGERVLSKELKNRELVPLHSLSLGIYTAKFISKENGVIVKRFQVIR